MILHNNPEYTEDVNKVALNHTTSIYLDFLRLVAALLVFAYHAGAERLNGQWLDVVGDFGHDAVIVFFVLSGFVIAYTTNNKTTDINGFVQRRLARLFSVAVPALLFTVIADNVGQYFKPEIYIPPFYQDSYPVVRFILNTVFLNEIWFTSWRAFSNGPFWSLSYEFFYYLLYAFAFYLRGLKRVFFVGLTASIAGPKILLLLPVWMLGILVYRETRNLQLSFGTGFLLFVGSIIIYALYRISATPEYLFDLSENIFGSNFIRNQLEFSRWFLNDYIVATLVALNITGLVSIARFILIHDILSGIIRYLAGMTFTLYLFHYPLLQLYASIFSQSLIVVLLTLLSVVLIASFTERRRSYWLRLINQISSKMRNHCPRGY